MQVLYLAKERGIDINNILKDVNQITFHESSATNSAIQNYNINEVNNKVENNKNNDENFNQIDNINNNNINNIGGDKTNNESEMSSLTVYFPDKIKMNNIMETKIGKNIPKLNFGYVPEYSSDSDSQNNNNIYDNVLMDEENLFFAKFNKFQNSI